MSNDRSTITSTVVIDGQEVADGSVEMVTAYQAAIRGAYARFAEARTLAVRCPEAVSDEWAKRHDAADRKLGDLVAVVSHFAEDYSKRGLDSAIADARWRKELA